MCVIVPMTSIFVFQALKMRNIGAQIELRRVVELLVVTNLAHAGSVILLALILANLSGSTASYSRAGMDTLIAF